jgi:GNAT superfamily N-acetyltransferase
MDEVEAILGTTNPFWAHAEAQLWIAREAGRDVGRIGAFIDQNHNQTHHERAAHFGYFETIDRPDVSAALFRVAFEWARARGMEKIIGPMSPSINGECGLLVDGFDSPPVLMMTYAPPYHARHVEAAGFQKVRDLLAFDIDLERCPAERIRRISDLVRRRYPQVRVRKITKKSLAADVPKIKRIYNAAWECNWGAVALTEGEIDLLVKRLGPLLTDGLAWLAEIGDEAVGFELTLPDANEFLKPLRGSLLSVGLLKALPYLVGWRTPRIMRLVALGTLQQYRGRGLEAVMFAETLEHGRTLGFKRCEASWVLEENEPVIRLAQQFNGTIYKRYRVYERSLS